MMKEIDCTASQVRKILSPCSGGLSAEAVKALSIHTKYGTDFSLELKDAAEREHASLVINLAADDKDAPISGYLVSYQKEKLDAAIKSAAEAMGAEEIVIVKTKDIDYTLEYENVKMIDVERALVLREESALYHMIESGELRICPLEKDFPSQGYQDVPAAIVDAETLCRIYEAVKPDYVESKLVVLRTSKESRIAEVKTGTTLAGLLKESGLEAEKSVLIGGVTGEFVGKEGLEQKTVDLSADWDSVTVYGNQDCLADVTRQLAADAALESCGKCVLCREGTWHFRAMTQDITDGKAKKEDLAMILDIGPLIQVGAFCSFGRKMARVVVTSVEHNRAELEAHFVKKTCPAGVCKAFAKLVIDPSKCTGCGDCIDVCDEDAINGKKKFIHIIDNDLCENCGECIKACEEDAIVMQDGTIRIPKKLVKVGKFK